MTRPLVSIASTATALLALMPVSALAQAPAELNRYVYGPPMMWWGDAWSGMVFGPLFMLVVLALVTAAVVLLARRLGLAPAAPARTSLDILKERFARGEIDKTEFEERRGTLEKAR